jgi:hypothetical protein
MTPIPLLDYVGTPIFAMLLIGLLILQSRRPLRRQRFGILRRAVRNFVFSAPAFFLLRLTLIPIPLTAAWWAQVHGFGLLHWLDASAWFAMIAGFMLMDWAYYWWHYATHVVPLLWRFHNVPSHRSGSRCDHRRAFSLRRNCCVDSIPRCRRRALGIAPVTLLVFEILFESASLFHHSNWRLPLGLERALNRVIVTPRMHGIHHSIVRRETGFELGHDLFVVGSPSSTLRSMSRRNKSRLASRRIATKASSPWAGCGSCRFERSVSGVSQAAKCRCAMVKAS